MQINLLFPILIPLAVAFLLVPLLRRNSILAAMFSLLGVTAALAAFAPLISKSGVGFVYDWVGPFRLEFSLTPWKVALLMFCFLFQLMGGIYMLRFITRVARPTLFLSFSLLAFSASAAVILTDNVLILLVAWEVFLVALYAVIHSGGETAEPVARKALIIGGASDFLMILGLMLYLAIGNTTGFDGHVHVCSSFGAFVSFLLIFLGAGAKAGMFPFHTWIPDAAEAMPAPGFALLPGSMEKILGIYFLYQVTFNMFALDANARAVMYVFGAATVFVSIVPALVERNFKKVLALTAICPVGFMVVGMATSEIAGVAGALMYMLTHAVYKSTMFFCAGNLETEAGGASLERIENRRRMMPLTTFGFLMAFAAATSLPPTGGFIAKDLILEALLERHQYLMFILLWIGAILMVAVFCKMAGVLLANRRDKENTDAPFPQVIPVLVLGAAALFTGSLMTTFASLFNQLLGHESYEWILNVWHFSPVTVASFAIYLFGAFLFFALRRSGEGVHKTFDNLRTSPALGRAYELAEAKRFDAYEIGLNVVQWIANVVFKYFERLVDPVFDWLIAAGRGLTRPMLSGIHSGVYSHYLSWVLVGFLLVAALLFLK
ncbi:MAG: NADH dehydrogenase [Acidobacteria bacterium]|nr:NADH dehydrogenase [Acidobacteriota bacterium]